MLLLIPLLATLAADPMTSNREAIQLLERALKTHGSEKDLRLTLSIRGDVINEGQSLAALAPFETYPFSMDVRIDQPARRTRIETRSQIAGDFSFTDILMLQDGKGWVLTPELKVYREVNSESGFLGRYFPHRVLAQALQNRPSLRSYGDGRVSFATSNGQMLMLTIDPTSGLLSRVEQVASLGIFGDGIRETHYEGYRPIGALMLPARMRTLTGSTVHGSVANVYRYEGRAAATIDPKELALPQGYVKGEWSRPSFNTRELARDVYLLENVTNTTGQWSYNVLVVVFDELVLVAEAPVSSGISEQVLARIHELAPRKPVRYLVQSHHHSDHLGGIRSYIAEGTTIIAGDSAKPLIERIASASFLLDPDRLQREPQAPKIETVPRRRSIRDSSHEVMIYNIGPNPHAPDMLILHLPKEKILWQSDMINDGEYPANASTKDFEAKVKELGLEYSTVVGLHGKAR